MTTISVMLGKFLATAVYFEKIFVAFQDCVVRCCSRQCFFFFFTTLLDVAAEEVE